jgi:hypothetical protein
VGEPGLACPHVVHDNPEGFDYDYDYDYEDEPPAIAVGEEDAILWVPENPVSGVCPRRDIKG